MDRVVVVGTSGTGKTTLARELGTRLDAAHLELDAVHHLPGWQPIHPDRFRDEIAEFLAAHDRWVVDGNYAAVRDLLWSAADTAVWLDLSRARTMWRVCRRSVARAVSREELWNGNREEWRNLLSWEPERSIIRWAWTTHPERRRRFPVELADARWQPLQVHRLCSPRDVTTFLDRVPHP